MSLDWLEGIIRKADRDLAVDLTKLCHTPGCIHTGAVEGPHGELFCHGCAQKEAMRVLGLNRRELRRRERAARLRNDGQWPGNRRRKRRK